MKKIFILGLTTLFAISAPLFSQQEFFFRGLPWGASKAEVIAKEGDKLNEEKIDEYSVLVYENRLITSRRATLVFLFLPPNDTLTLGWYSFKINADGYMYSTKPFIDAYSSLCNMLTELYGPPEKDSQIIQSTGSDFDDYAKYKPKGDFMAYWEQDGTEIKIELYPEVTNSRRIFANWNLVIFYSSPEYQQLIKEKNIKGL